MRISDWSSDVCSSDLQPQKAHQLAWRIKAADIAQFGQQDHGRHFVDATQGDQRLHHRCQRPLWQGPLHLDGEISHSPARSEEHTSELQSLMRISYAVFCLKKKNNTSTRKNKAT